MLQNEKDCNLSFSRQHHQEGRKGALRPVHNDIQFDSPSTHFVLRKENGRTRAESSLDSSGSDDAVLSHRYLSSSVDVLTIKRR